jgi:F0F1-type ATP synthase membrane subunit b/b'
MLSQQFKNFDFSLLNFLSFYIFIFKFIFKLTNNFFNMDAELMIMDNLKAKEADLERNLSETTQPNGKCQLNYNSKK